jgi:hypothetical protein
MEILQKLVFTPNGRFSLHVFGLKGRFCQLPAGFRPEGPILSAQAYGLGMQVGKPIRP